jgi:hypothetical protein
MTAGPESECLRRATRYSARGIEAAWPRRCAARFTRARCGDSRTRKDEKQQHRELGKCGYPHERFLRVIDPDLTIGNASSVLRLLKHPCRVANSAFEQPQVCFGVGFGRLSAPGSPFPHQ